MVQIVFWKDPKQKKIKRQASAAPKPKRKQAEKQHCKDFMKWLEKNYPFYHERMTHIANEGRVSIVEAMEYKRLGMKSGEPDYRMALSNGEYFSFNMEVKKEIIFGESKATVSPAQRYRGKLLREDGNCFEVCYGLAQMKEAFLLYINKDPNMKLQSAPYTKRYKAQMPGSPEWNSNTIN